MHLFSYWKINSINLFTQLGNAFLMIVIMVTNILHI